MTDQLALDLEAPQAAAAIPASRDEARERDGYSEEQRAVLDFPTDLVVTAGAGSGKTRTLVALYVRALGDAGLAGEAVGPARILCLTFTERAAREIQGRLRETLVEPDRLAELETAPISTFHAWCAGVLREHPLEAGVDPRYTLLSQEAADDLLHQAAVETLRRGLDTGDGATRQAVEILGLGDAAGKIAELVRGLRTAGWEPRRAIERFESRLAEVSSDAAALTGRLEAAADAVLAAARQAPLKSPESRARRDALEGLVARWRAAPSVTAAAAIGAAARSAGTYWRFADSKPLRDALCAAAEEWAAAALEVDGAPQLGAWPALTVTVRDAYRAARHARHALDYDDLLLRTRDLLLARPQVLETIRRRYRLILVDEHQDTDPVQDEILRLLLGAADAPGEGPRWCVVGDAQQSIYGFRGATVEAFEELATAAERRGARRALALNYRSRSELVEFHNAFFPTLLAAGPTGFQLQRPYRAGEGGTAVELLDPADLDVPAAAAREREARALAARLAAACAPADPDALAVRDPATGQLRPARSGDVVILIRRLTQVEPYRRALEAVGLESIVVGSGSFFARQEVFDVLNALEAALLPHDPVPLVAFLRSPFVGLPDDALWRLLRNWDGETPLRRHLDEVAPGAGLDSGAAAAQAESAVLLDELVRRADSEPPSATVAWLVDRTGYAAVLDALPDHVQRRANLERLLALADQGPAEGAPLLADWVALLRHRVERPPKERDASPPETGDRVRVMSIHQAKGLEFPVVVVADLGGQVAGGLGGVAFDPALGVVAKHWADPAADGVATRSYALGAARAKVREAAEEARLLYVAATRARDHLVLSAGARGHPWLRAVREFAAGGSGSLLRILPFGDWERRYAAALGQAAPLAPPGVAPPPPVTAAAGELAARELAEAIAGPASPVPPAARMAAREALRRGRRGHAALERLPLASPAGFDLRDWLTRIERLPPEEVGPIERLMRETVWPRLGAARTVHRERPFRLHLPHPGGIVTGTIDCLWQDADGTWWVWDYKLASEGTSESTRHGLQLAVYALAAATALGVDPIRGVLWYVADGSAHELAWDTADLATVERDLAAAYAACVVAAPRPPAPTAAPAPPAPPPRAGPADASLPAR